MSQDDRGPRRARIAATFTFVAILAVGWPYVWFGNSHDFGSQDTTTTVAVVKGPGASRNVTKLEPAIPSSHGVSGAEESDSPQRTIEKKEERPEGDKIAREKTTTEGHPEPFLESLIGDHGLVLLRMGAVVLAAFLGAAIVYRVFVGNFRFKVGALDFTPEAETVNSTAYGVALGESAKRMEQRMLQLEDLLADSKLKDLADGRGFKLGEADAQVPSTEHFVHAQAAALALKRAQSGLPFKDAASFEHEIQGRRGEFARERGDPAGDATGAEPAAKHDEPGPMPEQSEARGSTLESPEEEHREDLIDAMKGLLPLAQAIPPQRNRTFRTLIYPTIMRSASTYEAICSLLRDRSPVQAGVLVQSLFNDVIFVQWLEQSQDDPELLFSRFEDHSDAVARQRQELERATGLSIPLGFAVAQGQEDREAKPIDQFARRVSQIWWEPEGEEGATAAGLQGILGRLRRGAPFAPLADREGPHLDELDRLDRVVREWLSQFAHPSAVSLSFAPSIESPSDPTALVGFCAAWLFAQQLYLLADLNQFSHDSIDAAWYPCLELLAEDLAGPTTADRLVNEWKERYRHQSE